MKKIIINVKKLDKNLRLDKYLKSILANLSRQEIIRLIRNGKILIKGRNLKPSTILKGGEKIEIELEKERKASLFPVLSVAPQILYEDKNLLVINKPAGIIVHPTARNISEPSIAGWLIKKYSQIKKVGEDPLRPGIVHRLDKDTSGVLVIAKNQPAFYFLKQQFQEYKIKKKYLALVRGEIKKQQGIIDLPLVRSKKSPMKRKVVIGENEDKKVKAALTKYRVLKQYQGYTLLEVFPQTGRTHQIRVHLAAIGFPVAGDKLYGYKKKDKNLINISRQFLHAQEISFFSPTGEYLEIEAPLPDNLKQFLQKLSFVDQ